MIENKLHTNLLEMKAFKGVWAVGAMMAKSTPGSVKSMVSRGSQAPWKENKCKPPWSNS